MGECFSFQAALFCSCRNLLLLLLPRHRRVHLGQAEVHQLGRARRRDEDVRQLDVAVRQVAISVAVPATQKLITDVMIPFYKYPIASGAGALGLALTVLTIVGS